MGFRVPPSTKLRVASCHIDFDLRGLGADPASLASKLEWIDGVLRGTHLRPHLIVFPEGAACLPLHAHATRWADELEATTICGTSQIGQYVGGTVVGPNGVRENFYKKHLSPLDPSGASGQLLAGATAGIDLEVVCQASDGSKFTANVRVLICYDLRFYMPKEFGETQVVVVPMHDPKYDEPEGIAATFAKRQYVRTLLVNKATSGGIPLPSSAFAPMAPPFERELIRTGATGVDGRRSRVWRTKVEGVTIGEYEVAQYVALGHDTAYGAGFFYRVEHHALARSVAAAEPLPWWRRALDHLGFCRDDKK